MNILFYLHQYPAFGGIETVTSLLANAFVEEGYKVDILSHVSKEKSGFNEELHHSVECHCMPDLSVSKRNKSFLEKVVSEKKIDVIIFQDSYAKIENNLFGAVFQKHPKVIIVEHNSPFHIIKRIKGKFSLKEFLGRLKYPLHRPVLYWLEGQRRRSLYEAADFYVLLSSRFIGEFRALTRLDDIRKLRVIQNVTVPEKYANSDEINNKQNQILFVGSLVELKGCRYLLDVWELVQHKFPDWRLLIAGDGPLKDALIQRCRDRNLVNVEFIGYQKNVFEIMNKAKIFAFPSIREGWGLVMVEAMACGCVPVGFNACPASFDIIDDGLCGFLVPSFDVEAYASKMKTLMGNTELISQMGQAAVTKARSFNPDAVLPKWKALLKEDG